jgi:NAD(P)-dependent dehydrogenase (short-subunit alcohol dehydrogenase family)
VSDISAMKAASLFDLTGEVALVTGASSGLGARFARVLAANGAKVALVARRKDRLESLAAEIAAAGGQALALEADVVDHDAMARAFDEAGKSLGTVTICVNNAGIARSSRMIDADRQGWRETMDVNLDAVWDIGIIAAQRMSAAKKQGAIVNIASLLSFGVGRSNGAYSVAKTAVMQLTKVMGFEFAKLGVRANAIAPGYFATEMNSDYLAGAGAEMQKHIPMRRFGKEGELDGVLLLLAAPKAGAYINGVTYLVDGGHALQIAGV